MKKKFNFENVILVRTPFHFLNAIEYIQANSLSTRNTCLILNFSKRDYLRQLRETLAEFNNLQWGKVLELPILRSKNSIVNRMPRLRKTYYMMVIRKLVNSIGNVKRGITPMVGDQWVRHLFNKINCQELVLVDEGLGQLQIISDYLALANNKIEGERSAGLIKKMFAFDDSPIQHWSIFSNYDIKPPDGIIYTKHYFQHLKSHLQVNNIESQDACLILGAPSAVYFESDREYVNFIAKSLRDLNLPPIQRFLYAPHRAESHEQIDVVLDELNFELYVSDYPIELRLLYEKSIPATIVGFGSTAIVSLHSIFGEYINILYALKPMHIPVSDKIYTYLQSYNSKVVVV